VAGGAGDGRGSGTPRSYKNSGHRVEGEPGRRRSGKQPASNQTSSGPIGQHDAAPPERSIAIVEPPGRVGQDCTKASRSGLIVSACVVGMPCGKPLYVFSVPFCTSSADSGPESA
jgi:hypothetical protein